MHDALAAGILMACATMFARIVLVTSILNSALFQMLLPPLTVMAAMTYLAAFLFWRKADDFSTEQEIELQNPFQLGTALKFGAVLLAVMLLSKLLKIYILVTWVPIFWLQCPALPMWMRLLCLWST